MHQVTTGLRSLNFQSCIYVYQLHTHMFVHDLGSRKLRSFKEKCHSPSSCNRRLEASKEKIDNRVSIWCCTLFDCLLACNLSCWTSVDSRQGMAGFTVLLFY